MFASRPESMLPRIDICNCESVVSPPNRAVRGVRIVDAQEECVVLFGEKSLINLGHLAIKSHQLGGLNAGISCIGIELPANIVALWTSVVLGFTAGVREGVLPSGFEEPKLAHS